MCLHTFCANTCRQAFCESTCRQTFLNPKVKPPKSALSLNRLPAGILNTSVCISIITQCVWNVCREVFWAYTCASMLYINVSKSSAGRYSEYICVHLCYIAMSLNRLPAGILSTWTHSRGAPMTKIRPARPWALAPRSGRIFHTKGMLGRAARDEIGFGGFGWGARVWCLPIVRTSIFEQSFQISQKLPFASQNQKVAFFCS